MRIKLKHMEIEIRRRETTGTGAGARNESETLAKYEIMDGAPVRGENIPIRCARACTVRAASSPVRQEGCLVPRSGPRLVCCTADQPSAIPGVEPRFVCGASALDAAWPAAWAPAAGEPGRR